MKNTSGSFVVVFSTAVIRILNNIKSIIMYDDKKKKKKATLAVKGSASKKKVYTNALTHSIIMAQLELYAVYSKGKRE